MSLILRKPQSLSDAITITGVGNPAIDTPAMLAARNAIEAAGYGKLIIKGDVHLDQPVGFRNLSQFVMSWQDGGICTMRNGGYLVFGSPTASYTKPNYIASGTAAIVATEENQSYFQLSTPGSLDLKAGDWVALTADNEYTSLYSQHASGTQSRPHELHRILATVNNNSNQFIIDGFITDALTLNPRVAKVEMARNYVIERPSWRAFGDVDQFDGKNFVGNFSNMSGVPSGTSTDDWIGNINGSGMLEIRFWNGSSWVISQTANTAAAYMIGTVGLEYISARHYSPVPGEIQWNYFANPSIQDEYCEDKQVGMALGNLVSVSTYHHLLTTGVGMKADGWYGIARHVFTTGGESGGTSHRYGGVRDSAFYVRGEARDGYNGSLTFFDFHSEGMRNTVSGKVKIAGAARAVLTRARWTFVRNLEVDGDGRDDASTIPAGVSIYAPYCEVTGSSFRNLGQGIHVGRSGAAYQEFDEAKVLNNLFEHLQGAAFIAYKGSGHEFSHNRVRDACYDAAFGAFYGEDGAAVVMQEGTGHKAIQNSIPKYNNTYAFDLGNSTPGADDKFEGNVLTGYGQNAELWRSFDRSTGYSYQQQFAAKQDTDDTQALLVAQSTGIDDLGTGSGTVVIDFSSGNFKNKKIELTGDTTFDFENGVPGTTYVLSIKTNGHNITFDAEFSFFDTVPSFASPTQYQPIAIYYQG